MLFINRARPRQRPPALLPTSDVRPASHPRPPRGIVRAGGRITHLGEPNPTPTYGVSVFNNVFATCLGPVPMPSDEQSQRAVRVPAARRPENDPKFRRNPKPCALFAHARAVSCPSPHIAYLVTRSTLYCVYINTCR